MHDVIIIGSGPAGYTAAIYSARANLSPLVLASEPSGQQMPGGQLMFTTEVENFPGFPEGVGGPDLMELMKKQALRFGTEVIDEDAEEVDFKPGGPYRARSQSGWHESRTVIVATGAGAKWLQLPDESKFRNRGISACAVCDGPAGNTEVVFLRTVGPHRKFRPHIARPFDVPEVDIKMPEQFLDVRETEMFDQPRLNFPGCPEINRYPIRFFVVETCFNAFVRVHATCAPIAV